ncbi:MAG TPA: MFS transporter [Pseudonocardiaceae bacterium]|nr:MFS transporter [Pseudonocardiaceae bacterium]
MTRTQSAPPTLGRSYSTLWTAASVSALGDGLTLTAAPLMAASLTDDPRLIAAVTVSLTLPFVVFGIPAGVLVDRCNRRRAMVVIDLARSIAMLTLAVTALLGAAHLAVLLVCLFLVGAGETLYRNASQAIVPAIVARPMLIPANARLEASQTVGSQFLGPLIGSALFVIAPWLPFGFDAATFLVSAVLLTRLRIRPMERRPTAGPARTPFLRDMATGVRWLVRHRLMRALALTAAAINLVVSGSTAILVVYSSQVLGLSELGFGVLMACEALGAVLAVRLAPAVVRRIGQDWSLVAVVLAQSAACVMLWVGPWRVTAGAAIALIACAGVTWNVVVVALRQTLVPDELQGRVNSVYRLVAWGALPVGAALAGVIAQQSGSAAFYGVGALLSALIAIPLAVGALRGWVSSALLKLETGKGGRIPRE